MSSRLPPCQKVAKSLKSEIRQMRTAFPVQELPVRSALTVAANCVNRTRKHAASVTAYSVLRAYLSIQCSTPKLHQQTTGNVGNEKGLNGMGEGNYLIALAS